jgi:O-antigen/teichoic acid export membrane protein
MASALSVGKRNLIFNAAANWTGYAAQLAVAFFLCPLFVHGLGDDRYGIWSLVESILAYLTLLDLGVAASLVRYTSRFEATGDRENLNRVFSTSLCIFAAAGLVAFLAALGLAVAGIGLLHVPPPLRAETTWTLVLLGVNLALGLPLGVFPSMLDGLGRFPTRTAIRTAGLLARVPLSLAVLGGDGGMLRLACVVTATNVVEHTALAVALYCYLPHLRFRPRLVDRAGLKTIWGYSVHAFIAMLAGRISFQTDALVIGTFLAPQYITFFVIGARLTENAKNCLRAVTTVLTPAVSAWEARHDDGAIRRVLLDGTRWVLWVILPVQAGLIVLGRPFLALWMGPEYVARSYPTLVILAVPLGLAMSQSISGRILYGIGRLGWFARAVLLEAVANLVLSVALARPLGIEGVALGTAVPNVIANVALVFYICRTLGVRPSAYLRRSFMAPALAATGLAGFWLAAVAWAAPTTWAALVVTGAAGLAAYLPAAVLLEFGPAAVAARLRALPGLPFARQVGVGTVTSTEGSR